jgi:hypothetical protein
MNPRQIEPLASRRPAELRSAANRARLGRACRRPRQPVRQRAGWTLVEIGLRLAGTSSRA